MNKAAIVTQYVKMWPREVFDLREGNKLHVGVQRLLKDPGVYILYRDDKPYYIGKTAGPLFSRIWRMPIDQETLTTTSGISFRFL